MRLFLLASIVASFALVYCTNKNAGTTFRGAGRGAEVSSPPESVKPVSSDVVAAKGSELPAATGSPIVTPFDPNRTGDKPITDGSDGGPVVSPAEYKTGAFTLFSKITPDANNFVWVVTKDGADQLDGHIYYLELDFKKGTTTPISDTVTVTKKKHWTFRRTCSLGARTYVSEAGLVFALCGPTLYFVNKDYPDETTITPSWKAPSTPITGGVSPIGANSRGCAVSYKKSGKRFIGVGWGGKTPGTSWPNDGTPGNYRYFAEFPMADTPPYAINFSKPTITPLGVGNFIGYSCFIDQHESHLFYYSTFAWGGDEYVAVDLNTMKTVDIAAAAPNADFVTTNIGSFQRQISKKNDTITASYAFNGDPETGNLLVGKAGNYVPALEPMTKTVWVSGDPAGIFPRDCYSKTAKCEGQLTGSSALLDGVGPMSAMRDGYVAGLMRANPTTLKVLRLKTPDKISDGAVITVAATGLKGDPYMYTDFTGATLYKTQSEMTYDFTTSAGFGAKPPVSVAFTWAPNVGGALLWKNIKAEARCYNKSGAKGDYVEFTPDVAFKMTKLEMPSCKVAADSVDIRLTQLNAASTLMDVGKIQVTIFQ